MSESKFEASRWQQHAATTVHFTLPTCESDKTVNRTFSWSRIDYVRHLNCLQLATIRNQAVERTPYNKGCFMQGSLIHSTPQGFTLLQLLSHALIKLLLLGHLLSLSSLPLLVWINRHNVHTATICHVPVGQLLGIILTNVFTQRASGVWTALPAPCSSSW